MNPEKIILEAKEKVSKLCEERRFAEAIKVIDNALSISPCFVPLLIKKAHIIQLLNDEDDTYGTLELSKELLEKAAMLDEFAVYPKIELAHFLYAVEDNSIDGLEKAEKALNLCNEYINECQELIAECIGEIKKET